MNDLVGWQDSHGVLHQYTGTRNLDSTYTYNNQGEVTAMTYPSTTTGYTNGVPINVTGASYNYSYDTMYRLSGMTDSGSNTIVSNVSYDAANRLLTMNYPGANETRSYNVLGQLTNIHAGSSENLTYNYPAGTNNGRVSSLYNAISGETVTYTYDSLNRLATAGGSGWGEAYTFDPFGNLTTKQVTSGTGPSLSVSVNQSNNQITSVYGQGYDANGNTTDGNMTAYDAENHLVGAGWNFGAPAVDYGYDAQGKRSFMWTAGTFDPVGNNATNYSVVMYSPSGQKLGTYQISVCNQGPNNTTALTICSALQTSDKYFGGRRLAVLDQLGSAGTYYPWGEAKGTTNPQDAWSYATYWRDSATGLDYANQRYYSNTYGRFMTPDPYQGSASTSYPQSWNRYVYVVGDPVNRIDPGGLCGWWSFSDCADGEGPDFMSPNRPEGAGGGPCIGTGLGFESADPTCLKVFVPVFLPGKKPAKPPAPYLAALVLIGDCYDRSANAVGQAGGAAVDDLTYQALDQYGNPYLGAATINEKNTIMSGDTTSINTSWTLAGGMFEDNISSGIQSSLQELESYFVSGSVTPLTINWFYGAQYAVLGVYATPKAIIINNTVPVNKDGTPHYCDQPSSIQNR